MSATIKSPDFKNNSVEEWYSFFLALGEGTFDANVRDLCGLILESNANAYIIPNALPNGPSWARGSGGE